MIERGCVGKGTTNKELLLLPLARYSVGVTNQNAKRRTHLGLVTAKQYKCVSWSTSRRNSVALVVVVTLYSGSTTRSLPKMAPNRSLKIA